MTAFYVEKGILLDEEDAEYNDYNVVYDFAYGYKNELGEACVRTEYEAIIEAQRHIEDGDNKYYAIVLKAEVPDDYDFPTQGSFMHYTDCSTYNILYSVCKFDNNISHNFVRNQPESNYNNMIIYTACDDGRDGEVCCVELKNILKL